MALTARMVASEILMCGVKFGLKQIPIVGEAAASVVDNLQKRHETLSNADMLARFESQLSRVERGMRDTVEKEIRTILANLGRPAVPGPELTREMTELRQIYDQGWVPNLFEGILRNSTHWEELKRNPKAYGRILGDHEPVDPENGMHLLLDKDKTRILELPASSLAFLLGNQATGIPAAEVRAGQDIWAFPSQSLDDRLPKLASFGDKPRPSDQETDHPIESPPSIVLNAEFLIGEWRAIEPRGFVRILVLKSDKSCELTCKNNDALSGNWKFADSYLYLTINFAGKSWEWQSNLSGISSNSIAITSHSTLFKAEAIGPTAQTLIKINE